MHAAPLPPLLLGSSLWSRSLACRKPAACLFESNPQAAQLQMGLDARQQFLTLNGWVM